MVKNPSPAPLNAKRAMQVLIGIAVLVLLAGSGVLYMLYTQTTRLEAIATAKKADVGTNEQIARHYQDTRDNYNKTVSHIQYLESSVAQKAFVPTLLRQLQQLGQQTHLTVVAIRPGSLSTAAPAPKPAAASGTDAPAPVAKKVVPPPYDTLDINVDVAGTFADTATFLYDLTRFPKIVSVVSATFHPGAPASGNPLASPKVTTNLHLVAFVFHDDGTAAPQPLPSLLPNVALPGAVSSGSASAASPVPPAAPGSVAGAAGRAAQGAGAGTRAANDRAVVGIGTL